jgi:hypothetical protein
MATDEDIRSAMSKIKISDARRQRSNARRQRSNTRRQQPPFKSRSNSASRKTPREVETAAKLLGLRINDLTPRAIRQAFLNKIRSVHPDKSTRMSTKEAQGALTRMSTKEAQAVNGAHDILNNFLNLRNRNLNGGLCKKTRRRKTAKEKKEKAVRSAEMHKQRRAQTIKNKYNRSFRRQTRNKKKAELSAEKHKQRGESLRNKKRRTLYIGT